MDTMKLMTFAANTERRIQASIARARQPEPDVIDPVELSLHNVIVNVRHLERVVHETASSARCQQMADRLKVELDLIAQVYEQARDKADTLKGLGL